MRPTKRGMILIGAAVFVLIGLSQIALETYVDARAGGGRSGGFRGSRSFQSPSSIGLFEIILVAGLGYFLIRKFRSSASATNYGTMQYQNAGAYGSASSPLHEEPVRNDIDYRTTSSMDHSFDPNQFLKTAQDLFFKIQGAWNREDKETLRALCGAQLMQTWEQELTALEARAQKSRMDNIALRESEITESWTEAGEDYITVRLRANLLDFTVDEKTGAVVQGSNSEPVEFEEFWTFSRPVGPNIWKLTAVQQA
jgi:predicted lipid-binding transport protein (Tim44 family)